MTNGSRLAAILLLSLALLSVSKLILLTLSLVSVADHGRAIQDILAAGPNTATVGALHREYVGLRTSAEAVLDHSEPFLTLAGYAGWLPGIGPTLESLPRLGRAGRHALVAGEEGVVAATPVLGAVATRDGRSLTERLVGPLQEARPHFLAAQIALDQMEADLRPIDRLHVIGPLAHALVRIDELLPLARAALQVALAGPDLLGATRPRTYLLMAQNEDELRATGGFISAAGLLTMDKGRIIHLEIKDSYAVDTFKRDHPPAPAPLARYMDAPLWVFRDANVWPDFPTSAQAAINLYALGNDVVADGAIALDTMAIQMLLEGLGPVFIPEVNDTLDARNLQDKLQEYWENPPAQVTASWWERRKSIASLLVAAMHRKMEEGSGQIHVMTLGQVMLRALTERHILLYIPDGSGGRLGAPAGWDGALRNDAGDYLSVVDFNVGFNKANRVVSSSIAYTVTIDADGLAYGLVAITYHNMANRNIPCIHDAYYEDSYAKLANRCYWDFVRLYVPQGSVLVAHPYANDQRVEPEEGGKSIFSGYMVLPTGAQRTLQFSYLLPPDLLIPQPDGTLEYQLTVQKQAGTGDIPFTLTVIAESPYRLDSMLPPPHQRYRTGATFVTTLSRDRRFTVRLR